ncbi:hypothetical protein IMZ48_09160, partial [Candidatus Bathyarchaeota archaeon]|nr:hypothetical protein [Candidatus Bathyarchaeota archaeon]
LGALWNFTERCDDNKAAIILTAARGLDGRVDFWNLFTFYDGPTPPASIFDDFYAANPIIDTSATKSYYKFLTENDKVVYDGTIWNIATETVPLPEAEYSAEVLGAVHESWRGISDEALENIPGVLATVSYQPFTKRMAGVACENGGDLLDVDDDVNRILVAFDYDHLHPELYGAVDRLTVRGYMGVAEVVRGFQESGKLPEVYLPLFANDAYFRQDYFGRLKLERQELARRVANAVDPGEMWRSRTGGFKP